MTTPMFAWTPDQWLSWGGIDDPTEADQIRCRFPDAEATNIAALKGPLHAARSFHTPINHQLQVDGDTGDLYGAIVRGIVLHRFNAQGSDGWLGDGYVEINTISPIKKWKIVNLRMGRHFSKGPYCLGDSGFVSSRGDGDVRARHIQHPKTRTSTTMTIVPKPTVRQVGQCRAHARHKLRDGSEIAAKGLRQIAELHAIKAVIQGICSGNRLVVRATRSAPWLPLSANGSLLNTRASTGDFAWVSSSLALPTIGRVCNHP